MKIFGLTGGIGMGKSAAGSILGKMGIPVTDSDLIARQIVEPGQPALREIVDWLGPEILDHEGCLRRDRVAERIFADPNARKRLEEILHPRIRTIWRDQVAHWLAEQKAQCGVVVIPLLYETNAAAGFDAVICVACSAATQKDRLRLRGWNADQINQRIAAQWPVVKKMDLANYVVWTEGGLDILVEQLAKIIPPHEPGARKVATSVR